MNQNMERSAYNAESHRNATAQQTARRRAFTVVELIIVIAVIGIAAALALPMVSGTDATKLRAAANLMIADLAYAQIESITHGSDPRVVVFDLDADSYHIASAATPDTPITNPVGNLPYRVVYGQGHAGELAGVTIDSVSVGGDDQIQFGIYGQLDQTADATVTIGCGGNTMTITIDASSGEASLGAIE